MGLKDALILRAMAPLMQQAQQTGQDLATLAGGDVQAAADLPARLTQLQEHLNGCASAGSLSTLRQRLTVAEGKLEQKADTTAVDQQLQAVANVDADQAAALHQLQQGMAADDGVLQSVLAKVTAHENQLGSLRSDVDGKAPQGNLSSLSGAVTALRNTVNDPATGLAATKAVADAALPRAGGTMTGALNVVPPATPTQPLTASALPLTQTVQKALPAVALGGLYSFTVTVENAQVGQLALVNGPAPLLAAGAVFTAAVTAEGVVTIYLKAGAAILAGQQTFYLRVLR